MHTAIARFLAVSGRRTQRLGVYRQELSRRPQCVGRLSERSPRRPASLAGRCDGVRSARLRGGAARVGLREDEHRPASGLAARFLSLRPARRLGRDESGQAAAESAQRAARCRIFCRPKTWAGSSMPRRRTTPMGLRDRAILETMYSAGLRVSEVVGLDDGDLDFDAAILRVRGKGRKERLSPVGSYATRALERWLKVRQAASARAGGARRAGVREQIRAAADDAKRRPDAGEVSQAHRPRPPHDAALASAQFRHASARPRRRHSQRAGTAGPQEPGDDADLHARQHGDAARGVRAGASAGEAAREARAE